LPTIEQAFSAVRVCQWLSNGYQSIHLFRYDATTQVLYIIAGASESIEIEVYANGLWEFINQGKRKKKMPKI